MVIWWPLSIDMYKVAFYIKQQRHVSACFHNPYTRPLRGPLSHCTALPIKGTPISKCISFYHLNPLKPLLLSLVGKPQIIGNLVYLNGSRLDGDHLGVILLLEKWQEHRTFTEVIVWKKNYFRKTYHYLLSYIFYKILVGPTVPKCFMFTHINNNTFIYNWFNWFMK